MSPAVARRRGYGRGGRLVLPVRIEQPPHPTVGRRVRPTVGKLSRQQASKDSRAYTFPIKIPSSFPSRAYYKIWLVWGAILEALEAEINEFMRMVAPIMGILERFFV